MKFSARAGSLRDALGRARQIIPSTPGMVAYSGILFQCLGDKLLVTGSDGDTTMTIELSVTGGTDGSVLLVPKPIVGFLSSVDADMQLDVATNDYGDVVVSGAGLKPYTFRPLTATFPLPAKAPTGVTLNGFENFGAALTAVRPAHDKETGAVQLVSDDGRLVLYTTDKYRLACAALPQAGFGTFTGVLPISVLERVARIGASEVAVDLKNRQLTFVGDSAVITSRMLAVPFEPVETVLLAAPPEVTGFSAKDCAKALARLTAVADQGELSVEFNGSDLLIGASVAEVGSGLEVLTLSTPVAAPFKVLLRAKYLQEAVGAMGDATVRVSYSSPQKPVFLSSSDGVDLTHVIMPVRG